MEENRTFIYEQEDMSKRNNNYQRNLPAMYGRSSKESLIETTCDILSSDNPAKWIAGIAFGTIGVAGFAIGAISRMGK